MTEYNEAASAPDTAQLATAPARELGELLRTFTRNDVRDMLSSQALEAWDAEIPQLAARELAAQSQGNTYAALTALLCLHVPMCRQRIAELLGNVMLEGLLESGVLLGESDGRVRCAFAFTPLHHDGHDFWFAHDLSQSLTGRSVPHGYVMGIGGATRSLLRLTPREPARSALDIGTGCGVQAIVAASHVDHVVGTDISRRALDLAAFNARLNGVPDGRLELFEGSLLEPVTGRTFDLVVTNPPFVIAPRNSVDGLEYRQTGVEGDGLVLHLLRQIPQHLSVGGLAVMLANWLHTDTEWGRRLSGELPDDTDAWIMQRQQSSLLQYATMWLRDGGIRAGEPGFAVSLGGYLETLSDLGAESVSFGYICLRKTDGEAVQLTEDGSALVTPNADDVTCWVRACDWVRAQGTAPLALADSHLQVADGVVEVRYLEPGAGDPNVINLQSTSGRKMQVGQAMAALVGACDGELTLAQITTALSALLGRERDELTIELSQAIGHAVITGMLIPTGPGAK